MKGKYLSLILLPLLLITLALPVAAAQCLPPPPPPCTPGYTPGFWKHNIGVYLGENPGSYSAFNDGTKVTAGMLVDILAEINDPIVQVPTLGDAYEALTAKGPGSSSIRADMANLFNLAIGYVEFED
jgi:hypothetical protein